MKRSRLLIVGLVALGIANAQAITLNANATTNNGGSANWAIFFDLTAGPTALNVTEMTSASSATANLAFNVEVFVRTGTALGGPLTTGVGSSPAGWTSLGVAPATQGATAQGISLPIDIPDIAVAANSTVGVAVRFTGAGPRYLNQTVYQIFSDANLTLTTGDSRTAPFTTTGSFFTPRALSGSLTYELAAAGNAVSGTVTLNDTVGSPLGEPIVVQFYNGATLVDTQNATLDGAGGYTVNTTATGVLAVKIDSTHFLRKLAGTFTIAGPVTGVNAALNNGDVDSSDEVDAVDIDGVIAAFGNTGLNLQADLDNSQEVDAADIDIAIANFGNVSD